MAYSTQNMYQIFDIIPNFVRKMFPLSLKTYPSCTNPMAWDRRDEIRSAYILRMVHQRDNKNAIIDGNAYEKQNISFNPVEGTRCHTYEVGRKRSVEINSSHLFTSMSSRSEELLNITSMEKVESTPKLRQDQNIRGPSQPKSIYQKNLSDNDNDDDLSSSTFEDPSSGQNIPLEMPSTSKTSGKNERRENHSSSVAQNCQHSVAKTNGKSTVRREYQLLAQKFHQYTINCRTTIRTLEKKLKKLIDDKHALLHGMVSMRKGQKDVIKKYRKIFNDAMNEHCNEINALLANYKVVRDNYLELLQHDTSATDTNQNEEVISVSYTSYNCC